MRFILCLPIGSESHAQIDCCRSVNFLYRKHMTWRVCDMPLETSQTRSIINVRFFFFFCLRGTATDSVSSSGKTLAQCIYTFSIQWENYKTTNTDRHKYNILPAVRRVYEQIYSRRNMHTFATWTCNVIYFLEHVDSKYKARTHYRTAKRRK